ncbi:hypothetical protein ACQ86D_26495 [Streptomyces galilaeus]
MSTSAAEQPQSGMQLSELLALPVTFDLEVSNRALQLGRTKGFELVRKDEYPVRVLRIGRAYRVTRADLFRVLGLDPTS